jgi:predicted O-methyltransferase YrrM
MFTAFFDQPGRYAKWLHPGGPLQWDWEWKAMLNIFRLRAPLRVVEIGCFEGYNLEAMALAAPPGARLLGIDPVDRVAWKERKGLDRQNITVLFVPKRSDHPEALDLAERMDGIDWLFIDGDHTYDGARYDFATYGPMVVPGGVIALHDIYPSRGDLSIEVHRLWREIVVAGYVTRELVCQQTPTVWGGIGLVYVGA